AAVVSALAGLIDDNDQSNARVLRWGEAGEQRAVGIALVALGTSIGLTRGTTLTGHVVTRHLSTEHAARRLDHLLQHALQGLGHVGRHDLHGARFTVHAN